MDGTPANNTPEEGLIPVQPGLQPSVTIRGQAVGFLVYDIDPEQIPTETITQGGRRIFIDDAGALQSRQPDHRSHYEVLGKISEGGGGIVYSVHEKSLKREVALKICRAGLKPSSGSTLEAGEFTNEAYMTARLDHPGVVPIYALAKDADGRPFFSMKKVVGTSWKDLLHPEGISDPERRAAVEARAARMTWKDHLEVLLKVCDAVAYAHSKAILHRDLKPENILLGEYGEVFVMDWGLAIYCDERNEYRRFPDLKPQLAGTPFYIAPEMVRGEMTKLCPASDIYLLGGILYELLTGRPPHEGETVMDILRQAASGVVTPPEEAAGDRPVNPALAQIAMKALAARIEDRYLRVADFQQALRDVLAHSESMAICARAGARLTAVRQELAPGSGTTEPGRARMDGDAAAVGYGRLSECIGSYRQAIELWSGNLEAGQGLLEALDLQIRLAIEQDDLVLARAQLHSLEGLRETFPGTEVAAATQRLEQELAGRIERRQLELDRSARQARLWQAAAIGLGLLVLAGGILFTAMIWRQRERAIHSQKQMFAASVANRADMLGQFMEGIEQIVMLYRQTAVELMYMPADRLPLRPSTPAGRDGFYFDEDFHQPETQPPGMAFNQRLQSQISMDYPTVVRAPWARGEDTQAAVEDVAARLSRLNHLFTHFHRTRREIMWSIAGSETGLLVGFPGSARYGDKPDYDPTQRAWYLAAINATNDRPVWGQPYPDASTRTLIMSCMCRIHVEGRNVGVVGLEISLGMLHRLLLDYSLTVGGKRRSLLIRSADEPHPETGEPQKVHRVVIDTLRPYIAGDWQANARMPTIEEVGGQVAEYHRGILEGRHAAGDCHETGPYWFSHAPVKGRTWTFIAVLEHHP